MDGGTRIFIECAKHWLKRGVKINVFTCPEGRLLYHNNQLKSVNYNLWPSFAPQKIGSAIAYLLRSLLGFLKGLQLSLDKDSIIYSGSDFWPDALPAMAMKLKNPKVSWVAGFYLSAPKPWQKDFPYRGKSFFTGLFYWLSQLPIFFLIKRFADIIFVTSQPDVQKFITKKRGKDKIVVVKGGVDLEAINSVSEPKKKKYTAVFIGRFHPQKGILELIDIWQRVVKKIPKAKLALIGEGPLLAKIQSKIKKAHLESNVDLLGFLDGTAKIKIFKLSKVVLHPAIYDSGGMGPCEAMAAGLPAVSFDLEALKTYYPKGMLKTTKFRLDEFADNILKLSDGKRLYQETKADALDLSRRWDWNIKASLIIRKIKAIIDYENNQSI